MTTIISLEQLIHMNQEQLDALYAESFAGEIPDGATDGRAMFFPNSFFNAPIASIAHVFWQGKTFDKQNNTLLNRVLGMHIIKAKLYKAESWLDGKESIIIDYQTTSLVFGWIRDEIRQINPGLYLGRAYARTKSKQCLVVNFALQLQEKTS